MRIGVVCRGMDAADLLVCAERADGLDASPTLWLTESPGDRNPLILIAALGARTSHVPFATGVTPLPLRAVVDVIASVATLAELLPGRFEFGVGSGNYDLLLANGVTPIEAPLEAVNRYLDAYESAREQTQGSWNGVSVEKWPPIILAAHNRRMISLGASRADGLLLNMLAGSELATVASFARSQGSASVGMFQLAVFGDSPVNSVAAARTVLSGFLRSPKIRQRLHWSGSRHAMTADALIRVEPSDFSRIRSILNDDVVRDFAVLSVDELHERLDQAVACGIDFVGLSVFPTPLRLEKSFPPVPMRGTALAPTLAAIGLASELAVERRMFA